MFDSSDVQMNKDQQRSIYEIVSQDGAMGTKNIFAVVKQLLSLWKEGNIKNVAGENDILHPKSIYMDNEGNIQINAIDLALYEREAYLPPEQSQTAEISDGSRVYSIGMLMLFMATGNIDKSALDTSVSDRSVTAFIGRCIAFDPQGRFRDTEELLAAIKERERVLPKLLAPLLAFLGVCAFVILVFVLYQSGHSYGSSLGNKSGYANGYAQGYEKGFSDAPGIGLYAAPFDEKNGNTSGNISFEDGAVAVRSENETFYIFNDSVYKMDLYSQEIEVLVSESGIHGLNYHDGWLYYCSADKIMRVKPETAKTEVFCDSHAGNLYIADGNYYVHDTAGNGYLYSIDRLTGSINQLNGLTEYKCLNIVGKKLYFIDSSKNNSIYACDLDGGSMLLISSNSYDSFCIYERKIYGHVTDPKSENANSASGFLVRMDLNGGNLEALTDLPAYYPNVTEGGIFFVSGNNKTLEWLSLDGRTHYSILSSRTGMFNLAGRWIFYINEDDGGNLWRVRIDGSGNAKVLP